MTEDPINDHASSQSATQESSSAPIRRWLLFLSLVIVLLVLYGLLPGSLTSIQTLVRNVTFYDVASLILTLVIATLGALALTQSVNFARDNQAHSMSDSLIYSANSQPAFRLAS